MASRKRLPGSATRMADLARQAGVSASTVSRALAGSTLVAKAKREQILKLARDSGYVVNTTARNLRLQRTQQISVVIPLGHEAGQPLTDPFFVQMLGHLADEITTRGYGMLLQKVLPPMENWLDRLVGAQRSDGIIVIGQSTEHRALEAAARKYQPLVVWGGHMPRQHYCSVGSDNTGGAMLAVSHLLETGRRRIVFLGETTAPEMQQRYEGYVRALSAGPRGTAEPHVVPAHLTPDAAYEAVRSALRSGPRFDAVFAATDVIAISAMRAISASGLRVPQDIAVAGYDDVWLATQVTPTLTTVRQDLQRGAHTLVDLLFRRMEGEDTPSATMPAELVVRESTAPR
jgi:DNA-binding LacI/PurR family transcriptional regulator